MLTMRSMLALPLLLVLPSSPFYLNPYSSASPQPKLFMQRIAEPTSFSPFHFPPDPDSSTSSRRPMSLYSQIDPHRRSNRPSTIPATINLISKTLRESGALLSPLDRATAANDAVTAHLARLEADKSDVDADSIVLTTDETVIMAGRVIQVVVRYEQLYEELKKVASGDDSVGSWGKMWDVYGITNKSLFDGDKEGGVDAVAEMRKEVITDESVSMLEELYLSTRIGCLLGLFVVQHEAGLVAENKIEGMGVVDFLEDEVVEVLRSHGVEGVEGEAEGNQ